MQAPESTVQALPEDVLWWIIADRCGWTVVRVPDLM